MGSLSLRWKIALSVSVLLVALIATTLVYINYQAESFVSSQLAAEFDQSARDLLSIEVARVSDLDLTAGLLASFPDLNALLNNTDAVTIRDFLVGYQQNNRIADLLITLDPAGEVLARTDLLTPDALDDVRSLWLVPALAGQAATGILELPSGYYYAAARPATAGGLVFGFVIAASGIDASFVAGLRESGFGEIVIVGDDLIATTIPEAALPGRDRGWWTDALETGATIEIDGQRFAARGVELGGGRGVQPLAIVLGSVDRAMEPYRNIQTGLLILGLLATALGVGGSVVLGRRVTAPVARLVEGTRQVTDGNFDYRLAVDSRDELGELSDSFNSMVRGLRERQDMQRFISQSTAEMIQSRDRRPGTTSGEKVSRTIFFSDIRGFTEITENQPPEETVRMLNRCLSLQAALVKKFHGDVDKFVGDSVVAVFDGEDMALNAIRCAVEIQRALDADNRARPREVSLHIGIGIVTGEIIMGSLGSDDRSDFTVIGSNVNLCARLCGAAAAGETLLSESTYDLVRDLIAAEKGEPVRVKGFSESVPVFRMAAS